MLSDCKAHNGQIVASDAFFAVRLRDTSLFSHQRGVEDQNRHRIAAMTFAIVLSPYLL